MLKKLVRHRFCKDCGEYKLIHSYKGKYCEECKRKRYVLGMAKIKEKDYKKLYVEYVEYGVKR